ncbi:MAG: Calcium-translocating P-type ATPase, PMCA-type [Candidatus Roizmanbacteria bacterium GW2011_GWA2_33_33]|uniref:P-type Cu(+) transporter n=2 Tax=Candidatus Roizmaniibacteriota TaxID=1752723 RepID=A0A0G0E6D2_9BACT|nr:MAG: Calcium-translocating P-type ATPase, PMCA-type [Candidatus Roizmanbacteria bacterium GW2011_GWA2_33_33]KKP62917.1 MAG: Calcium-translocating P-type ATPase, PMCA-type [Candidatus Roizmanbacteria bacterium GW2011_GWC2_34_23]
MKGLTSSQVSQFLTQYGFNIIAEQKKKSIFIKFFEQFNNFLTILLIGAAMLSYILGETLDGGLIIGIVILNGLFGLYQEAKAEESLAVLKKMTVTKVRVIRDGKEIEIDSKFLVPGDLVYLEEGIKVPADGYVTKSINLEVNESALTGESFPVIKIEKEEVFSGTIVAKGRGYIVITKTGDKTKFGEIAHNLSSIEDGITPLQKKLADLTRIIGIGGIALSIIVFLVSMLEGTGYFPAFLLSVSLAVAVVPEGLPAVMTITLAIGMKKMAGKKAIIRKLSAIEALGSITLIATDKTGTLTTNKMQVKEVWTDGIRYNQIQLDKTSQHKTDSIQLNPISSDSIKDPFSLLLLNGILCSTASLVYIHDHGSWDVLGDPTEGALLFMAQKQGLNIEEIRKEWQLIDEKPFDSVTKMMSVVVRRRLSSYEDSLQYVFSKGAPESIINICKLTNDEKKKIKKQVDRWAEQGLRVLAFGYKQIESDKIRQSQIQSKKTDSIRLNPIISDFIFLGMVAIHDAPRPEVRDAVLKAKNAGIKVVMITGDNEKTAEAIGVSSGLIKFGDEILTGFQLEEYNDDELLKILPRVKIFARTNPFQKHRIVSLYQRLGEIVAVTGDGVNDAIALKQADVGVAMGLVGTDVARETADMVVTDDNFATIITAIEEGRNIINSIKNAIKYLLSCNVSEAIALIIGLILGLPTLFYPIQLLYINLVTDGLPALILAFAPRDAGLMSITPEKEMVLLKNKDQSYIGAVGIVGAILVITSYFIFAGQKLGGTAAFSVLTIIQSFVFIDLWLSHRHIHENVRHLFSPLFILAFIIPLIFQFIILSHPFSAGIFKILPVSTLIYFEFVGLSILVLTGIFIVKKMIKIRNS